MDDKPYRRLHELPSIQSSSPQTVEDSPISHAGSVHHSHQRQHHQQQQLQQRQEQEHYRQEPPLQHQRQQQQRATTPASGDVAEQQQFLSKLHTEMAPYLDAVDELRDEQLSSEWPVVAVVGGQSDGKSTLLQAISGLTFPTGIGTVTVCPVQLALRTGPQDKVVIRRGRDGEEKQTTREEYGDEIMEFFRKISPDKKVSDETIFVRVEGPKLPSLTLLDLPGLVETEQKQQVEQMVSDKIRPDNVLMLVVQKAVNDSATQSALELARRLDQSRSRTLVVLTHCDNLPDNKIELVRTAMNDAGTFAVNAYGKLKGEEEFSNADWLSEYPSERLGVSALTAEVARQVYQQVQPQFQEIRSCLLALSVQLEDEVEYLKASDQDKEKTALLELRSLTFDLEYFLKGAHPKKRNVMYSECLQHFKAFAESVMKDRDEFIKNSENILKEEMGYQLQGELPHLEAPFPALERAISERLIDELRPKVENLISQVVSTVDRHQKDLVQQRLREFPQLMQKFHDTYVTEQEKCHKNARQRVLEVLEVEKIVMTQNLLYNEELKKNSEKAICELKTGDPEGDESDDAPEKISRLMKNLPQQFVDHFLSGGEGTDGAKQLLNALLPHIPLLMQWQQNDQPGAEGCHVHEQYRMSLLQACAKAYAIVSASRIIDTVPAAMRLHFMHGMAAAVGDVDNKLRRAEIVQQLLDNPDLSRRLKLTEERLQRVRKVKQKLPGS